MKESMETTAEVAAARAAGEAGDAGVVLVTVDGAVVTGVDAALDTLRWVRENELGHVRLVVADEGEPGPAAPQALPATAPAQGRWALDAVTVTGVSAAMGALLRAVVLVEDLAQARAAIESADARAASSSTRSCA